MTKILLVGDLHISDKAPRNCTESYTDDILDILRHVSKLEKDLKADAVVFAGDIFHHKVPSRTSHALVMKLIRVLQEFNNAYIVVGNHDQCVSDDTEALTDQGWKLVGDLNGTEKFATLNKDTKALEFQTPSQVRHFRYTGVGYHFKTRAMDLLVTPQHAFWGAWRASKPLRKKTAEELSQGTAGWRLPAVESYSKGESPSHVQVGNYSVPVSLAARLFGWFVAEGTSDRAGCRVTISQSVQINPDHYAEIMQLITDIGLPFSIRERMIRINDRSVTEFFIENFGFSTSQDVRIPQWLFDWAQPELREFLWAYFRGDGTINGSVEDRAEANYATSSVNARCANSGLADDLSAIGVRVGYKMRKSIEKEFPFGDTGYIGHAYELGFNLTYRNTILDSPVQVEMDEMVWCPTLPNETWLARRNGIMCWTGNSSDRVESVWEKQPLGVIFESGAAKELNGWDPSGLPLFGVPWQQRWLHEDAPKEAFIEWESSDRDLGHSLVVTHAPIYPPSTRDEQMFELVPTAGPHGLSEAMGHKGYLYYGHIHEDHGIWVDEGVTYANMGAISRGSLTEYNLNREVKICMWTDSDGFTEIPVPHKPASEVFRIMEATEKKEEKLSLEGFLADVGNATLDISSTFTVIEHIRQLDVAEAVKKVSIEILEEVDV